MHNPFCYQNHIKIHFYGRREGGVFDIILDQ